MAQSAEQIKVYIESGDNKTFATALDWPGWSRVGRDEPSALQSLIDYGPRYAHILQHSQLGFHAPTDPADLHVVERQKGNMTTDFGAPNLTLPGDTKPIDDDELHRFELILKACWRALDNAVEEATGHTLKKGPRGGGRELDKVMEHVQAVDASYLSSLGGKLKPEEKGISRSAIEATRKAILATLAAATRGEIPAQGPRGGQRWTPRYFVRRHAWHELDHVWEIEDRIE